jgi:hypothetical protein
MKAVVGRGWDLLPDRENGARGDIAIDVGGAIQRIESDTIFSCDKAMRSSAREASDGPAFSGGTMMGSSFSSETRTQQTCEWKRALTIMSFESTSNFFWSSPVAFSVPACP